MSVRRSISRPEAVLAFDLKVRNNVLLHTRTIGVDDVFLAVHGLRQFGEPAAVREGDCRHGATIGANATILRRMW